MHNSLERHSEEPAGRRGILPGLDGRGSRTALTLALCFLIINGCAYPISENLRRETEPVVAFSQVIQSPEAYIGKKVIFGGTIVKTTNFPDTAEIEVVQKELDTYGHPARGDATGGRFIFTKPGYVEPEIYAKGREITGAGKVVGSKAGKVDDREYRYPVIEVEELHLWDIKERYYPDYPYWGYPYYPYYPYSAWRHPYYW